MFQTKKPIGLLCLEAAQLSNDVPDVDLPDGRLLTQEELAALVAGEKDVFSGTDISVEELEELVDKYALNVDELELDIESVFMAWTTIRSAKTDRDAAIAASLAAKGFKRLDKLYNLTFEDAAATGTTATEKKADDKADSGFLAGVRKMWTAFVDMLKKIWNRIKEFLFGPDSEKIDSATASAKNASEKAAETASELVEAGAAYISVKSSVISFIKDETESGDLLKVLEVFKSGVSDCSKVIESYKTLATKVKNEFKPDMKDVDPTVVKENLLKALMADIKSSWRDTPSAELSEAIKIKTGMDTTTTGSEKWALCSLGLNETSILIHVDQLGSVPNATGISSTPNPEAFININVTDFESVMKSVAETMASVQENFTKIRNDLAEITNIEKSAIDMFEKPNANTAKDAKVTMDALFAMLKGTPKIASAIATVILKQENVIIDLNTGILKAIEAAKKTATKKKKEEAKENKKKNSEKPDDKSDK